MFVHSSVHISRPIKTVSAALARSPQSWFSDLGNTSRAHVGPRVAGVSIRKEVEVEVGEPVMSGTWTEVPITWRATSARRLFPVMTGKVELAPVDTQVTRLTVSGMYEAPLGRLGKSLDDAVMHEVAEATVRDLAVSIARRLEAAPA